MPETLTESKKIAPRENQNDPYGKGTDAVEEASLLLDKPYSLKKNDGDKRIAATALEVAVLIQRKYQKWEDELVPKPAQLAMKRDEDGRPQPDLSKIIFKVINVHPVLDPQGIEANHVPRCIVEFYFETQHKLDGKRVIQKHSIDTIGRLAKDFIAQFERISPA